ncbi:unnamed protein product [Dimorphilus gyrociliatus]|uniref:Uncharacterized protein n=1 Tax=Dimorphilus gyrociliatus TaxID=2664684 RepID=A0A7I8VVL7_9ANNE|nr:unnamed protein product [Dimorphilus gyrociliatus]
MSGLSWVSDRKRRSLKEASAPDQPILDEIVRVTEQTIACATVVPDMSERLNLKLATSVFREGWVAIKPRLDGVDRVDA